MNDNNENDYRVINHHIKSLMETDFESFGEMMMTAVNAISRNAQLIMFLQNEIIKTNSVIKYFHEKEEKE